MKDPSHKISLSRRKQNCKSQYRVSAGVGECRKLFIVGNMFFLTYPEGTTVTEETAFVTRNTGATLCLSSFPPADKDHVSVCFSSTALFEVTGHQKWKQKWQLL